ncbi:putative small lipoprotein YifL [Pantoea allii]|uniref:LPS-assembly lipoprotein LptM n=1 Tax=Pantoea allii TaxID=574096 RepID=A0A2V2B5T0_9GAMM|nr:lipoprotein [Pantoea allii]MCH9299236.1 lipoprotein [Pantoea allii]PWK94837.1 putative small lipoprotein YifL [Pantoea allii]
MKKVISLLAMTMALTSLTGCGLKGPLYFPPQDTPKQTAPTPASTQKQKTDASKADVGGLVTGDSSSQMK